MKRRSSGVVVVLVPVLVVAAVVVWLVTAPQGPAVVRLSARPFPDPTDGQAGFGPVRVLSRTDQLDGDPAAAIAPTGRTIVMWRSATLTGTKVKFLAATGPAPDRLGPPVEVAAATARAKYGGPGPLRALADGTIAFCIDANPKRGQPKARCSFSPPGQGFGALRAVSRVPPIQTSESPGTAINEGTSETGKRDARFAPLRHDGKRGAARYLPRPGPGFLVGDVIRRTDGSFFAVTQVEVDSETDCSNVTSAAIGAGPLATTPGVPAERLSKPGQLPDFFSVDTLTDGAVIAVWGNTIDQLGADRLEVAIRPAGASAFGASQVLPNTLAGASGYALATGNGQAILTWTTGAIPDGPQHVVVSVLRRGAPYAMPAALPTHPMAPCG